MDHVIPAPALPSLAVRDTTAHFPVHRIYCVGRNFAEHAKEMGAAAPEQGAERGTPVFFMKPADAVLPGGGVQPFPSATRDLHHEVELVVALGRDADGIVPIGHALDLVYGYGVGLDLTRRDLQAIAKDKRLPWDTAKGFDRSAPVSELIPVAAAGHDFSRTLRLQVNGQVRQQAPLSDMIFSVAEIVHALSKLYELKAGDLIFMGTPAGVAAFRPGDRYRAELDGLVVLEGGFAA